MRIIGGSLRSRKFDAPPGNATRPTGDRAKVAIFNILQSRLEGARVLDGFAGSGALSFEALSRGAAMAVLFEADGAAASRLFDNAAKLGLSGRVDVRQGDFMAGAEGLKGIFFDVVFLDPPYSAGLLEKAMAVSEGLLAPNALLIAEHSGAMELPDRIGSLFKTDSRRYGAVSFSFYKRQGNG